MQCGKFANPYSNHIRFSFAEFAAVIRELELAETFAWKELYAAPVTLRIRKRGKAREMQKYSSFPVKSYFFIV
ncbi:hypothetical protein PbDSM24746_54260 [Paenibacillus macerans]|nr:hypothetical protein PbDSM24746_54260 [Paenibacillus macerans]GBK71717.1 hypothetical protein PbJCM17693_54250 [Paenibacillus macerans]GIP11544.1 hypothetical protein J1TS5_37140 [Paenibacillus macerans]